MRKTSKKTPSRRGTGVDWSKAIPNPYAAALANSRWRVELDPDLVDLLSGTGGPSAHLAMFAARREKVSGRKRERLVMVLRLTDDELRPVREVLERIGAKIEYVPPHPNAKLADRAEPPRRRKAG
jgi:hypothetical protein